MVYTELTLPVNALRDEIDGTVIIPGDADYDAARMAWNLAVDQYPALILIAESAADVAAGVRYARSHDLGIAIQSTGHGVLLPANDCLLIMTSHLSAVSVDAASRTAWVEAGVLWGAVLEQAQAVGLAPLLGSSSGVGAVGYTLGGGMGWLARKYGLAVDSVLEFEVVTADGQIVCASETEHSDLFWALRGGAKGALGVVTGMRIRLYEVTTVYGGSLIYSLADAREVFAFYREWIQYLPEEWTTSISIMNFPPMPELPPFLSGQSVVMVNGCYVGDAHLGQMMVQALPDWKQPIANTFHPMPFIESDTISNDPMDPMPASVSGGWLTDLSDETVETLLAYATPDKVVKAEVRYAGGAIARVNDAANAYDHRSSTLLLEAVGMTPTPEAVTQFRQHIAAFKQALQPHMTGGVYMNFLDGPDAHDQTANAFSAKKYQRLGEIKAKYDPENRFRFGYRIPTSTEA